MIMVIQIIIIIYPIIHHHPLMHPIRTFAPRWRIGTHLGWRGKRTAREKPQKLVSFQALNLGVYHQNGWFIMEKPIKMDDLGENHLFLETPISWLPGGSAYFQGRTVFAVRFREGRWWCCWCRSVCQVDLYIFFVSLNLILSLKCNEKRRYNQDNRSKEYQRSDIF